MGGLVARRGPRPVILGGLGLIVAGCAVLAFLRPETPYPVVLVALVLIGVGNIAVVTPVTEIVLGSVPAERSGGAAALNNAAMQVGGALGAATLTSVFLDAARADYAARLASTGLSLEKIREITRAWRQAVGRVREHGGEGAARGDGATVRGRLPRGLHGRAWRASSRSRRCGGGLRGAGRFGLARKPVPGEPSRRHEP